MECHTVVLRLYDNKKSDANSQRKKTRTASFWAYFSNRPFISWSHSPSHAAVTLEIALVDSSERISLHHPLAAFAPALIGINAICHETFGDNRTVR